MVKVEKTLEINEKKGKEETMHSKTNKILLIQQKKQKEETKIITPIITIETITKRKSIRNLCKGQKTQVLNLTKIMKLITVINNAEKPLIVLVMLIEIQENMSEVIVGEIIHKKNVAIVKM